MADRKATVRAGVASSLTAILGEDQHVRKVAEEELKALEVMEGWPDCLQCCMQSHHLTYNPHCRVRNNSL